MLREKKKKVKEKKKKKKKKIISSTRCYTLTCIAITVNHQTMYHPKFVQGHVASHVNV